MPRSVYARIFDLRAIFTDTTKYPDTALLRLLELSADIVEAVTQQFFGPRYLDFVADGLGRRFVEEANQNKIIEVKSLEHRRTDGSFQLIEARTYSVLARRVRLRTIDKSSSPADRAFVAGSRISLGHGHSSGTGTGGQGIRVPAGSPANRFPYDDQNVRLAGVFGWLDLSDKVETTLAADLSVGDVSVSLTTTDELLQDDVLLIDNKFWVIVGSVTLASIPASDGPPAVVAVPGTVAMDPSPGKATSGASVVRYGRVPRLIREAVLRTAVANKFAPGSDEELAASDDHRIKREKTDNYEIEFFAGQKKDSASSGGTGDPKADTILSRFRSSTISGAWA